MPSTTAEFHSNGIIRKRAVLVTAFGPPQDHDIQVAMPHRVQKAFARSEWKHMSGGLMKRDLYTLKGEPIGTVFVHYNLV